MISLRRFLLWSLSSALIIVIGLAASIGYLASHHESEELMDGEMAQYANLLYTNLQQMRMNQTLPADGIFDPAQPASNDALRRNERYANHLQFQYWDHNTLLARSSYAPEQPLHDAVAGFHNTQFLGLKWRVYVLQGTNGEWLALAERDYSRRELAQKLIIAAMLPILLGLPVLLIIVWLVVNACVRQLEAIANELQQRDADDLHPIGTQHSPRELHSILIALNNLFARLKAVMDLEKRFTADAAHELRTPIAATKLHIQNAIADTPAGSPAQHSLQQAEAASNRMQHIVQQLLALNRGLIQGPSSTLVPLRLDALASSIVQEHQAYATQHQQQLTLSSVPASVNGHADMLQMLLRNLVDNALRYTPDGGRVNVQVQTIAHGSLLTVSDSGPGIPAAERERVLERFYRLDGDSHASGTEGCGLGLSIVKRVADYHGATLVLDEDPQLHGLRVQVIFHT